jgi:hypothetical protein
MKIPEGTCTACEFKEECEIIRQKFYGTKLNDNRAKPVKIYAQMNGT